MNRIGAIPNFIDVRYTSEAIKEYILETNSKMLITLDMCLPKIKNIISDTSVDEVIYINPANSTNKLIKTLSELKSKKQKLVPNEKKYVDWNEFIKRESNIEYEHPYEENYPALCRRYVNRYARQKNARRGGG